MKATRLLTIIIVLVLVLAGIQWYMSSRPTDSINQYGTTAIGDAMGSTDTTATPSTSPSDTSVSTTDTTTTNSNSSKNFMHTVTIETNKGPIVFETYDADAPKTVENFITLANKGFYNGLIFHRVINGFMIQGGDPTGTGSGGPGYAFKDELNPATPSYKAGYVRGTVAMANAGPDTNGSQFFIMQKDTPALPNDYTIFGRVVSGMDVVDAIATTKTATGDRPVEKMVMNKVTVK
jgi:cyclophilin family peptidyl-prolyl cis-trans isomerase